MSVKDVVENHIRAARLCRERYMTMSQVDWLVGGVLHSLRHSMDVVKDKARFTQKALEYVQELRNSGHHEAAEKVGAWINGQHA